MLCSSVVGKIFSRRNAKQTCGSILSQRITVSVSAMQGFGTCRGEGDITNVAVLPEYRKNGIGSMLISEMIKTAVTLKLELLLLKSAKCNIAAQGL